MEQVNNTECIMSGVRISWNMPVNYDLIWTKIMKIQDEFDTIITSLPGVHLAVSCINGLYPHTLRKGEIPQNVKPAISYWLACDEAPDLRVIRELLPNKEEVDVKHIYRDKLETVKDCCTALFSAMKDYNSIWVENKIQSMSQDPVDRNICKIIVTDDKFKLLAQLAEPTLTFVMWIIHD